MSEFLIDLESTADNESKSNTLMSDNKDIEEDLWHKLIDLMSVNIAYTIKRLLPADLKTIYTHKPLPDLETKFQVNPFTEEYKVSANFEKGGINVCENVVYNW